MATLHSFFVFNSSYGPREGEEIKKIMYYYPPDTDENTKCRDVGLAEAMVKFVETFTSNPCQSVHTQRQRHLYYQPEPEYWMLMKLNLHHPKEKADRVFNECHDENIHDNVYGSVLRHAYNMFKLFMGRFSNILKKAQGDVKSLKQRLEHFYSRYLITLKLSQCDILDVHNGIAWLPLEKSMYLRLQCLINRLQSKYPEIVYTAFLCSDYLVWTGVPQQDMRTIYQYLITSLFPAHHEQEMTSSDHTRRSFSGNNFGQFITGLSGQANDTKPSKIPRVHITHGDTSEEYQLLVYRALSVTICSFVRVSTSITPEFCRRFDADLGPTLTELASDLTQVSQKTSSTSGDMTIKYIYFNHMNLAMKTTVHVDTRKTRLVSVPREVLGTIADMKMSIERAGNDYECFMKTTSDCWVVGKKSESREVYVVISDRNANLSEISKEVRDLCNSHFAYMFSTD